MSLRILLVDDEPDLRLALRMMLTRSGFDVTEAADGVEAVERWRDATEPFAVVVLDQRMPRMTGLEAAAALREDGYRGGLLLFSGHLDAEARAAAAELGVPTMAKVDVERIATEVRRLADGDGAP